MEDVVHHRLECGGGIAESEEHDKGFKDATIGLCYAIVRPLVLTIDPMRSVIRLDGMTKPNGDG